VAEFGGSLETKRKAPLEDRAIENVIELDSAEILWMPEVSEPLEVKRKH
jgi:hypothetical protein